VARFKKFLSPAGCFLIGLGGFSALNLEAQPEDEKTNADFFSKTSANFEIVGSSAHAVAEVSHRAEALVHDTQMHFARLRGSPQAVFLRLIEVPDAEIERPLLTIETGGRVALTLPIHGASFKNQAMAPLSTDGERMLLRAWLLRRAIWHVGPREARVARWLESALLEHHRHVRNRAYGDILSLTLEGLDAGFVDPISLLQDNPQNIEAFDAQSFLLFHLLNEELKNQRQRHQLWQSLLTARVPKWTLKNFFQQLPDASHERLLWFVLGAQEWIETRQQPIESPLRSREFLAYLRRFSTIHHLAGHKGMASSLDLLAQVPPTGDWDHWVSFQRDRLASLLPKVNPMYHNALQSHGTLLEAYLERDFEKFQTQLKQAENDWQLAEQSALQARRLLINFSPEP
jgi:hypothetical protein